MTERGSAPSRFVVSWGGWSASAIRQALRDRHGRPTGGPLRSPGDPSARELPRTRIVFGISGGWKGRPTAARFPLGAAALSCAAPPLFGTRVCLLPARDLCRIPTRAEFPGSRAAISAVIPGEREPREGIQYGFGSLGSILDSLPLRTPDGVLRPGTTGMLSPLKTTKRVGRIYARGPASGEGTERTARCRKPRRLCAGHDRFRAGRCILSVFRLPPMATWVGRPGRQGSASRATAQGVKKTEIGGGAVIARLHPRAMVSFSRPRLRRMP